MATDKQSAANRQNAQKSTGPKTPEGRAAVRLNGVKHGLTAETLVLPGEDTQEFEQLLDSFFDEHQPATPTEEGLVRRLAMAEWRQRRLYRMEAGFFTFRLEDLANETHSEDFEAQDGHGRLAMVAQRDSAGSGTLPNFARYEAHLERTYYRALHELQRIRAQRESSLKNQTQFQPSPAPLPKQTNKIHLVEKAPTPPTAQPEPDPAQQTDPQPTKPAADME